MPRIPVHLPDPKLPQPIATPEAFGSEIGEAVQDLGQTLKTVDKQIDDYRTQNQISELNQELTEAQSDLNVLWREKLSTGDPYDEDLSSDFMRDVVQPRLTEITSGVAKTRRAKFHATGLAGSITASFQKYTFSGQVELSTAAAVSSIEQSANQISTAAFTDPAGISDYIQQMRDVINSQNIDQVVKIKLMNDALSDVAFGAAAGAIERNPGAAVELLDKGALGEYLSGKQIATLLNSAQAQVQSRNFDDARLLADRSAQARSDYIDAFINDDGSIIDQATPEMFQALETDERLQGPEGQADKEAIFKFLLSTLNKPSGVRRSDDLVVDNFTRRIALPFGDTNRLTNAEVDRATHAGLLLIKERDMFLKAVAMGGTPQGAQDLQKLVNIIKGLKGSITSSNAIQGKLDKAGDQRFGTFENIATAYYLGQREAGFSHKDLVTPESPIYVGLLATQFFLSIDQSLEEINEIVDDTAKVIVDPVFTGFNIAPEDAKPIKRRPDGASQEEMAKRVRELRE